MTSWIRESIRAVAGAAGFEIVKRSDGSRGLERRVSLGRDPFRDMKTILGHSPACIFDVGANDGETALSFSSAFPAAMIYSFEPDPQTFERLTRKTQALKNVHAVNSGLGRTAGKATLIRNRFDATNSLLPSAAGAEEFVAQSDSLDPIGSADVAMDSVDDFCERHRIARIEVLKIDTQGYELEVLSGATQTLQTRGVPLIYAEVSFIRYYDGQPLFDEVYRYAYDRGYRMVGIYESGYLTHYYQVGGNALFVHESIGKRRDRLPSRRH
jgi:FkbM family methyltransferase